MNRKRFLLLATLILALAAFLRLAELSRYPPGLHYDEAADMLLGRDIAFYGFNPFPVVSAYSGREALFYYLSVPLLRIFGTNIMATRLTSVFLGILTVAVTVALGRAMFRSNQGEIVALLAGAWLAINGPQVWLSRQGFRTSPQPFLEALCIWLLLIALRRGVRGGWPIPMALSGMFAGLSLYAYMAARIFPLWLLIPLAALIVFERGQRALRLWQVAVFLVALAITALPIAVFYVQHPDVLLDRLTQVASSSAQTPTLLESLGLHLKMFFIEGDPLLRYNLYPGRPFFDPISGLLMLVGLAAAAWLIIRRGSPPIQRTVGVFLLLCPLLIIPSVVAVSGLPPSHMRSVAMVPLVFFLPALGIVQVLRGRGVRFVLTFPLLLLLALNTWGDYRAWGARADVFYDSDGDLQVAARWLEQNARPDELMYIASKFYEHPTVLAHNLDHGRIRWMVDDQFIIPPPDRGAVYIFPRSARDTGLWKDTFQPRHQIAAGALPAGPDGAPAFRAFRLSPGEAPIGLSQLRPYNYGGLLRLDKTGNGWQPGAGCDHRQVMRWQVLRTPDRADLAPVVALYDAFGNEIARAHPYIEHTDRWLPGERFIQGFCFAIPPGNPPGEYVIRVAWVGKNTPNYYVPRLDEGGRFAGIWAEIARVRLDRLPARPITPPDALAPVIPGLYLLEPPQPPAQIEQGDTLTFRASWLTTQAQPERVRVQVTAENATGAIRLWEGDPVHGTYPVTAWQPGEQVIDRYAISTPPDLPAGEYRLRLYVQKAGEPPALAFEQPLTIVAAERNFTPPNLPNVVDLSFGSAIRLIGYEAIPGGDEIRVTLAWKAVMRPDADYTVFVHVVNPDGTHYSQIDRAPARPTSRWIAGEIATETYTLKIPDGPYRVRIGLYVQENGLRLPISDGAKSLGDALFIRE